MSGRRRATMELGHDAFLDIVANLVGILIILVVVLGAQSQRVSDSLLEPTPEDEIAHIEPEQPLPESIEPKIAYASQEQLSELSQMSMRAAAAQRDSMKLERTIVRYDQQLEQIRSTRAQLLDLLTIAEETWQEKQGELDQSRVRAAKLQSEIQQASTQLAALAGTKEQLASQSAPVVAVEHLPTPMAKTVYGDEIHLRLKANHLSVVPLDPLLDEVKRDFSRSASGTTSGRRTSAVGPIRGYVAHFALDKTVGPVRQGGRTGMGVSIRLAGLVIEPLKEPTGQPIEQILSSNSFLDVELAGRDTTSTTITVWVYPDSFAAMRRLKEHLYNRGFATAARPLTEGRQITVSPNGSRSRAQ